MMISEDTYKHTPSILQNLEQILELSEINLAEITLSLIKGKQNNRIILIRQLKKVPIATVTMKIYI